MALWPLEPSPKSVLPQAHYRPLVTFESDRGYKVSRPRTMRGKRRFQVTYNGISSHELYVLMDFITEETGDGAYTFQWVMPEDSVVQDRHTVDVVNNSTPIAFQTRAANNFRNGDWIGVSSSGSIDGVYQITRLSEDIFQLNGTNTTGGITTPLKVGIYLPFARLVTQNANQAFSAPTKYFGPIRDHEGLYSLSVVIEEEFG